jgi:hypothetical protein
VAPGTRPEGSSGSRGGEDAAGQSVSEEDGDQRSGGTIGARRWLGWAVGGAVGLGLLGGAAIAIGGQGDPGLSDPGLSATAAPLEGTSGPASEERAPSAPGTSSAAGGPWTPAAGTGLPATTDVVPVGSAGEVGAWTVSFGTTDPDAVEIVDAGDAPYHDELGPGDVLVLATVTVRNGGNQPLDPAVDLLTGYLGADGTEYDVLRGQFCMAEGSLYDVGQLAPGELATGTVCQGMPEAAVEGGAWVLRPADDYGGQVLFAPR